MKISRFWLSMALLIAIFRGDAFAMKRGEKYDLLIETKTSRAPCFVQINGWAFLSEEMMQVQTADGIVGRVCRGDWWGSEKQRIDDGEKIRILEAFYRLIRLTGGSFSWVVTDRGEFLIQTQDEKRILGHPDYSWRYLVEQRSVETITHDGQMLLIVPPEGKQNVAFYKIEDEDEIKLWNFFYTLCQSKSPDELVAISSEDFLKALSEWLK